MAHKEAGKSVTENTTPQHKATYLEEGNDGCETLLQLMILCSKKKPLRGVRGCVLIGECRAKKQMTGQEQEKKKRSIAAHASCCFSQKHRLALCGSLHSR
jgi:hypothetical protein